MATNFEDGLKDIFLAGVGALALTGEKTKEIVDTLIEKGSLTVEQGKDINCELSHRAAETVEKVRTDALAEAIKAMTPEERDSFAATVTRLVNESKPVPATGTVPSATDGASAAEDVTFEHAPE